jgi:hypothetical protein
MVYSEIIAVCSEIHTKHINTLCGQNVEFVDVKHGGNLHTESSRLQNVINAFKRNMLTWHRIVWQTNTNDQEEHAYLFYPIYCIWQVTGNHHHSWWVFYGANTEEIYFKQLVLSNVKL